MYTVKEGLTAVVVHLRKKVTSLQVDLDNNVVVQNDLARLSQSLQVELENFRQAEKEVGRWSMVTDGKEDVILHADVWLKGSSEKEKFILFGRRWRIKGRKLTIYTYIPANFILGSLSNKSCAYASAGVHSVVNGHQPWTSFRQKPFLWPLPWVLMVLHSYL